jgi:hypothetical protein
VKVFRIRFDADKYQVTGSCPAFVEDYPQTVAFERWAPTWRAYEFPIGAKSKKRGDFIGVLSHVYLASADMTEKLRNCIASDVETLPTHVAGEAGDYFLWNIVNYVDVLDESATQYENAPPFHVFPSHFAFHATQIERPMIFKVPQHPHIPLVATGLGDERNDFCMRYHELKCRGLAFELLWQSTSS